MKTPAIPPSMENVRLRPVSASDLPILYEQQLDPQACIMADFPSREWEAFLAHWTKILANEAVTAQTILFDGQVAGNIVCFEMAGKQEVGYWLGREFWGRGIATWALGAFLELVKIRPLYGYVVKDNLASRQVLEKYGFVIFSEERDFSNLRGVEVEGYLLKLDKI